MKLVKFFVLFMFSSVCLAQTCNPNIIATAPDSRYTLNANGTALDKKTGLMWMRCALGQTWSSGTCTGSVQNYTWQNALQAAESTVFASFSDWRLPNIKELQSLVEERCYGPAINLTVFPNAPIDSVLSSSPYANNVYSVWIIYFYMGNSFPGEYISDAVRLVRSGQ